MRRKIYREDIINAGKELMYLQGYNGVSIKDITEKVNIPKGSFYNHFESKEGFAQEVLQTYAQEMREHMENSLDKNDTPPLQRLSEYFEGLIQYFTFEAEYKKGCLAGNLCQELGDVNASFCLPLETTFEQFKGHFQLCLEEAKALKQLPKGITPVGFAEFMHNSWQGALLRMKTSRSNVPLKQFHQIIFKQILNL